MAPVVHGLEKKYQDYLSFSYIDIDDKNGDFLEEQVGYDRRWRPYIMLLTSTGETHKVFVGVVPGEDIELAIQELLVMEGVLEELQ